MTSNPQATGSNPVGRANAKKGLLNFEGAFFLHLPSSMRTLFRGQRSNRWWVYIVPKGENFYVGITTDPPNRLRQHGSPVSCYLEGLVSQKDAVALEKTLKSSTHQKKRDLIFGSSKQK